MSEATETGVGFPGVARVETVDETNGYVLVTLKPWTVYQPGIDQQVTTSNHKTYTNAEFDALDTGLSRTAEKIQRSRYDAERDTWTFPV